MNPNATELTPHEQAEKYDLPRWKVVSLLTAVDHGNRGARHWELNPLPMDPEAEGVVA